MKGSHESCVSLKAKVLPFNLALCHLNARRSERLEFIVNSEYTVTLCRCYSIYGHIYKMQRLGSPSTLSLTIYIQRQRSHIYKDSTQLAHNATSFSKQRRFTNDFHSAKALCKFRKCKVYKSINRLNAIFDMLTTAKFVPLQRVFLSKPCTVYKSKLSRDGIGLRFRTAKVIMEGHKSRSIQCHVTSRGGVEVLALRC